jgi:hypothetical protein
MGELIGLIAVGGVFSIPIVAIWTAHQRKMLEMKQQMMGRSDSNVTAAIEELRQELRQLRDTTLQYDLSFDSALQRMESRVETLERRAIASTDSNNPLEQRLGR